ncbi:MAG: sigma-54-dependent Fis family transcriptional regulator [Magnetococcales bacterium]|nr:sigma-54-dependent Fis family transcriptional regulator [Magnetococcales bacterium]
MSEEKEKDAPLPNGKTDEEITNDPVEIKKDADDERVKDGEADSDIDEHAMVFRSESMKILLRRARHVATLDWPILLQGESGTGKDVLARLIHRASNRSQAPFVCVNCGAIPENLVEAELFGHEKGAFTGAVTTRKGYVAEADTGTLFLDEIGELSLSAQVKLLRVIQEREVVAVGSSRMQRVDFRIIAATNRNLLQDVAQGRFRNDLFHRVAVAVFKIPPLRSRLEDLESLIHSFVKAINRDLEQHPVLGNKKKLSDKARMFLMQYDWPGNIRELRNTLLRAMLWSENHTVKLKDIEDAIFSSVQDHRGDILAKEFGGDFSLADMLSRVADHYFNKALRESGGNKALATRLLGLPNPTTFSNWSRKYPWEKNNNNT